MRPIADVTNTPTQKIDWLTSIILNQLVKKVPVHLDSSQSLITILESQCQNFNSSEEIFISLDVNFLDIKF